MRETDIDEASREQNNLLSKIEDLPVNDAQQDEVKGGTVVGMLVPAVQKVREGT